MSVLQVTIKGDTYKMRRALKKVGLLEPDAIRHLDTIATELMIADLQMIRKDTE